MKLFLIVVSVWFGLMGGYFVIRKSSQNNGRSAYQNQTESQISQSNARKDTR